MDFYEESTYRATRLPVTSASTLTPEAYRSADYHRAEIERLWVNSWVCVGLAVDVAVIGSVAVRSVAGRSVLLVRGEDELVRAFLNVCRHRGTELLDADCEVGRRIRCPYHAWAYALDGSCVGTPMFDGSDIPEDYQAMFDMTETVGFDRANYGLFEVRLAEWEGLLFANVSGSASPLDEWLGDLGDRLGGYGMGTWKPRAAETYEIHANWKLVAENFMEYYHLPWVHPELVKVSRMQDHYRFQGSGMYTGMTTTPISRSSSSAGWLELPPSSMVQGADANAGRFILLFPNVAISLLPNHAFVMVLQPDDIDRTTERTVLLASDETMAGPESQAAIERLHGFWDHVNLEDIEIVERVQRGVSIPEYTGGRMCYRFEEPLHRFQNMVIDQMVGISPIPPGDSVPTVPMFG